MPPFKNVDLELKRKENLELATALMGRPRRREDGFNAIRAAFPHAPEEMVQTAAFHLYTDGVEAAIDFVAAAEQMIREPAKGMAWAATTHLAYHLYNWMQFEALLPSGQEGVIELVKQVRQAIDEKDLEFADHSLELLESLLNGTQREPRFE